MTRSDEDFGFWNACAVAVGLAIIALLWLLSGCGGTVYSDAHRTILTGAEIVAATDVPLARAYRDTAAAELDHAVSLDTYHAAMEPWDAVVTAQRTAAEALAAADSAVMAAEHVHAQARLGAILGCAVQAVKHLVDAIREVRPSLVPEQMTAWLETIGAFSTCEVTP